MRCAVLLLALLAGCSTGYFRDAGAPPEPQAFSLDAWPHRDLWTGVVFNGQKIGFTRRQLRPLDGGSWEIESEAVMRIRFLGVDKKIRLHEVDRVGPALELQAFRYENEIDGNRMQVSGSVRDGTLSYDVKASGTAQDYRVKVDSPLYPTSALVLLPVARGLKIGPAERYAVFHGETQSRTEAEIQVLAYEKSELFEGPAFKVSTRLLGLETTTWIAADGRPLFELGLNGVMISALEDETRARQYLVEASLNKNDTLLEFSLVRSPPIEAPRRLSRMEIDFSGVPDAFTLPSDGGQSCARTRCRIDRGAPLAQGDPRPYLKPTLVAPSNLGEIRDLALEIARDSTSEAESIARLIAWMDANIAKEAVDAFTAADVLRARRGECQGHAYLFAAFARALGIPTRIVNGLAYSDAHGGFLYHTWNEAWIKGSGWQPVDATFSQARADATHVKLLEGESAAELAPLVNLLGRIRVSSVGALAW